MCGRVALERRTIHIIDARRPRIHAEPGRSPQQLSHALVGVPLLRHGVATGVIVLVRAVVELFSVRPQQMRVCSELTSFQNQVASNRERAPAVTLTARALSSSLTAARGSRPWCCCTLRVGLQHSTQPRNHTDDHVTMSDNVGRRNQGSCCGGTVQSGEHRVDVRSGLPVLRVTGTPSIATAFTLSI
jgi:hypothetical protein